MAQLRLAVPGDSTVWPFSKKPPAKHHRLVFKGSEEFFAYQCQFGQTALRVKQAVVAMVLDGAKEFGLPDAVRIEADGSQFCVLKVASDDGGFIVVSTTPTASGDRLVPGDMVLWVPLEYAASRELPPGVDPRTSWVGFIVAKIDPVIDLNKSTFNMLCRYDQ